MKSIITLLFILLSGASALANTNDHSVELNPNLESYEIQYSQMVTLLDGGIIVAADYNEVKKGTEKEVARLYKFKNSRIKKALSFKTKRNNAKRA